MINNTFILYSLQFSCSYYLLINLSERVPLRGCLNPDGKRYIISYINQEGSRQDIWDETKTLRQLKPFKNVFKFGVRSKNKQVSHFKTYIGKFLISS